MTDSTENDEQDKGEDMQLELNRRLRILILNLLRWQFLPIRHMSNWRCTIRNERFDIEDIIVEKPNLIILMPDMIEAAYSKAVSQVRSDNAWWEKTLNTTLIALFMENRQDDDTPIKNAGLKDFPKSCPWAFEQIMDTYFWPEPEQP